MTRSVSTRLAALEKTLGEREREREILARVVVVGIREPGRVEAGPLVHTSPTTAIRYVPEAP